MVLDPELVVSLRAAASSDHHTVNYVFITEGVIKEHLQVLFRARPGWASPVLSRPWTELVVSSRDPSLSQLFNCTLMM